MSVNYFKDNKEAYNILEKGPLFIPKIKIWARVEKI